MTRYCAWPNCEEEGTYPAPRDPRNLADRQYFCLPHIKEFNKRWNGLEGFSMDEIYTLQTNQATMGRPTWQMGINPTLNVNSKTAANPFANAHDLFEFFKNRQLREGFADHTPLPDSTLLPPDVKEACTIFNIEVPLPQPMLKKRYINLMKQHHPDVNKAANAEEFVKRINVAFKILTDYANRHGIAG
jgi:hypothetical protein